MGKKNKLWMLIGMLQVLLLLLVACGPAATSSSQNSQPASTNVKSKEPVLSDTLSRGCGSPGVFASDKTGLAVGAKAINFTLKDTNGTEVRLSHLLAEKPVIMIFGSFS
jgi:cytochrome oxidase Cu insertion factor (SCO1/SenC/PrrC family)